MAGMHQTTKRANPPSHAFFRPLLYIKKCYLKLEKRRITTFLLVTDRSNNSEPEQHSFSTMRSKEAELVNHTFFVQRQRRNKARLKIFTS